MYTIAFHKKQNSHPLGLVSETRKVALCPNPSWKQKPCQKQTKQQTEQNETAMPGFSLLVGSSSRPTHFRPSFCQLTILNLRQVWLSHVIPPLFHMDKKIGPSLSCALFFAVRSS
jgi:hypothetical protein